MIVIPSDLIHDISDPVQQTTQTTQSPTPTTTSKTHPTTMSEVPHPQDHSSILEASARKLSSLVPDSALLNIDHVGGKIVVQVDPTFMIIVLIILLILR